jgi:acyl-CoA synthetase (AMP-forming)/AMP-acid ligase II
VPSEEGPVDEARLLAGLQGSARAALADYKAPDRMVVVDRLPLTPMLKVDKRTLLDRAARLPALRAGPDGAGSVHDRRQPANGARAS